MMNLEQARELNTSLLWASVIMELDIKIHFLTQKLQTCTANELLELQMQIKCYQSLKQLPADVIAREES